MSNQVFHFSNTGISSGQRFYLKDDVSGIFLRNLIIDSDFPVLGSNLVYNTGNQTISGVKSFENSLVLSDNLLYLSQASGQISGNGFTGFYDGGYFLGDTKITQNNMRLQNVGNTWTAKDSARDWRGIAMSSDGKYQTAVASIGQVYISSDYGNTWVAKLSNRDWRGISMSSDGKYQTAVISNGQIYISSDYGNTWTNKDSNRNWTGISMSSDGKYQTATVYGERIFISSDYGNTWIAKDNNRLWVGVSISSVGKYQTAITINGQIYISSDYGNTWAAKNLIKYWTGIAMSSDGKYQTAVVTLDRIYVSSDYGNIWTDKDSSRVWQDVTMSSDGKYQTAIVGGGEIYISSNYGNTWTAKDSAKNWSKIAMSSDGKYQTAVVSNGQIYISVADEFIDGGLLLNQRPIVNGTGVLLSGEVAQADLSSTVRTTGDQTISGIKNFASRPTVNGTGVLLSGESILDNQISNSTSAGRTLLTSSVQGQRDSLSIFPAYDSYKDLVLNGPKQTSRVYVTVDNWRTYTWSPSQSQYIEVSPSNLFINTIFNSDFNNLNGLTFQTSEWSNGVPTGWSGNNTSYTIYSGLGTNNFVANIGQLSTGPSGNSFRQNLGRLPITSNVELTFTLINSFPAFGTPILNAAIYDSNYNNLATGSYITTNSGTFTLTGNSIPANTNIIVGFWTNQGNPALDNVFVKNTYTNVASIEDIKNIVYNTGDQTISGNKNFVDNVYIKNLFVTGTETIVSTTNFNVQSPYLLLNLTGGAVDGGIFFVTGSGLSGINDYGPIIGFDHSNKFKFGIARRSDDLSVLNDIAAVQDITNYSGFINNKYATILNLASTGSNLQQQINNINSSGFITGINTSNFYTKDNPSGFIINNGLHKYYIETSQADQYLKQEEILTGQIHKSGMENGDLVNLYFEGSLSKGMGGVNPYSKTLKVNPGVIVDYDGGPSNRNLIKFPDDSNYSGKAIRKVRYNSTVGNGYERFVLSTGFDTTNCPIIRPKTRRLETFYDISVPSGGGIRYILFNRPTSFPFVQGTCMNLRFSFEADSSPCVISGLVYGTSEHVLTISGANYSFVQKERVILISKGGGGNTAEFKHW